MTEVQKVAVEKQVNVLIAEDEANIALALKSIVGKAIGAGKVTVVTNGQEALEALESGEYDLVISDWNMPRLTGLELLAAVRANKNSAHLPFLMLTARADVASVKSAVGSGVSDYIVKPFDKAKLVEKVVKFLGDGARTPSINNENLTTNAAPTIVESIVAKFKKGDIAFPVLPDVAFKAVEVINSKDVSLQHVADLIKVEVGLTTKIIALANSSHYRATKPIQDLQYAIGRIGLRDSANLILTHATHGLFNAEEPRFEMRQQLLWEHSLATATGARLLGKLLKHPQPERLYTAGMLHDIGKMLLIQVLMELGKTRNDIEEEAIDEILDRLHIEFGAALLKRWKFPDIFIDVIRDHHNQEQLHKCAFDTLIVIYANLLTSQQKTTQPETDSGTEALEKTGKLLGISHEQANTIRREITEYVEATKNMI